MPLKRIVVTSGEPAGIGPDLCVMLAQQDWPCELVVAGDARLFVAAASAMRLPLTVQAYAGEQPRAPQRAGRIRVLDIPASAAVVAGRLDPANASYVVNLLDRACDGCLRGEFDAMVTAPVQKSVLLDAGFDFSGHTEYLAQRCGAAVPVMMLVCPAMRVALVTTHLPLSKVPAAITRETLAATLNVVNSDLQRLFKLDSPRILLLGLNPHAGESGHLGREEVEIIEPVADALRSKGMRITGPVPADTAFGRRALSGADAVVAMYHDQGLPVIKYAAFGSSVNLTLGLPIVRTSVDHGTALSLARSGTAEAGSLEAALELALALSR